MNECQVDRKRDGRRKELELGGWACSPIRGGRGVDNAGTLFMASIFALYKEDNDDYARLGGG